MKYLMGNARLLLRGLKKVKTELSLSVLAYNLKRVVNLLGAKAIIAACC